MLYPQERMYQEMTFLSYYLHWSRDEVMRLNHLERRRWCREVSAVNKKLSNTEQNTFEFRWKQGGKARWASPIRTL